MDAQDTDLMIEYLHGEFIRDGTKFDRSRKYMFGLHAHGQSHFKNRKGFVQPQFDFKSNQIIMDFFFLRIVSAQIGEKDGRREGSCTFANICAPL